jgi:hypothetical protein
MPITNPDLECPREAGRLLQHKGPAWRAGVSGSKLPGPTARPHTRPERRVPGTARRLGAEQVKQLIADYRAEATVCTLGSQFGIDRRTVGAILKGNGVVSRPLRSTRRSSCTRPARHWRGSTERWA